MIVVKENGKVVDSGTGIWLPSRNEYLFPEFSNRHGGIRMLVKKSERMLWALVSKHIINAKALRHIKSKRHNKESL